jgi:hypothetical protein
MTVPSLLKDTALTGSECAGRTLIHLPVRRVLSSAQSLPRRTAQELTFLHVPDPDRLIHPPRCNQISPRVPRQTQNRAQMSIQYPHRSLPLLMLAARGAFDLPDSDSSVVGGGSEEGRVGGEGDVGDAGGVGVEGAVEVEGGERVDVDG